MKSASRVSQLGVIVPIDDWYRAADEIEYLARSQRLLGKYRRLISDLRRRMVGERCGERAAAALEKLKS